MRTDPLTREQLTDAVLDLVKHMAQGTGADITAGAEQLARYTAVRAEHLATLVDDPDFQEAVRAEADVVFLHAGIQAVHVGDGVDSRRWQGLLHGVLAIAAQSIG